VKFGISVYMAVLVTWLSLYVSQVMDYEKELKIMENLTKEEYLASLRRCILSPGKTKSFFR